MTDQHGARKERAAGTPGRKYHGTDEDQDRPYDLVQEVVQPDSSQIYHVLMGLSFCIDEFTPTRQNMHVIYRDTINSNSYDRTCTDPRTEVNYCRVVHASVNSGMCARTIKTRHWHISKQSQLAHGHGAVEPIACTCPDWRYRGLYNCDHNQDSVLDAKFGCKHMIAIRETLHNQPSKGIRNA